MSTDSEPPLRPDAYDVAAPVDRSGVPMPRFERAAGASPLRDPAEAAGAAVPLDPPHHCPTCRRHLGGLQHHVCPDCGKPFTLEAARICGSELSEEARQDRRAGRNNRIRLLVGLLLMAIGYFGPILQAPNGVRFCIMCTFDGTIAVLVICYKVFFERPWANAALTAGLAMLAFAGLLELAS